MKTFTFLIAMAISTLINAQVTVVSPNGGEVWAVGSTQQISISFPQLFVPNLWYSIDSGVNWSAISGLVVCPLGTCNIPWIVPNKPSTTCLIKVMVHISGNPYVYDTSNAVFTISGSVGIKDDVLENKLTVWNDPANQLMSVSWDKNVFVQKISLYNTLGAKVIEQSVQDGSSEMVNISTASLPSGIYIVRSEEENNNQSVRKIYIP